MKTLFVWMALFVVALPLCAQIETPTVEFTVDYTYLNQEVYPFVADITRPGSIDRSRIFPRQKQYFPGGTGFSVVGNLSPSFGVVADFSFHRRNTDYVRGMFEENDLDFYSTRVSRTYFLFGPRYSVRSEHISGFFQVLLGGLRLKDQAVGGIIAETLAEDDPTLYVGERKETAFTGGVGAGFDINFSKKFAIRPVQIDFLPYRSEGRWLNNFRYKGGFVLRF